jgi:uncharacterized OB-fold protein
MPSSKTERPLPLADDATAGYWQACQAGSLAMQRCVGCEKLRFPPRPMCPGCQSFESEWVAMSGRGRLYSWVVCHPPLLPAFASRAPLVIVLVELEESPALRIVGNLFDCPSSEIEIGMPLEVFFEEVSAGVSLPQWRPEAKPVDGVG